VTKRWQIGLTFVVIVAYGSVLLHNLSEGSRRSLKIEGHPIPGDSIATAFRIVAVNLHTSDMTARMSFRLQGTIAKDPVTPAVDLTLFLNDIRGPQEFVLRKGHRINPIEVSFSINGDENKYPIDTYTCAIRLMVTKPGRTAQTDPPVTDPPVTDAPVTPPSVTAAPVTPQPDTAAPLKTTHPETTRPLVALATRMKAVAASSGPIPVMDGGLVVTETQESEVVPLVSSLDASVPGLKFEGGPEAHKGEAIQGFDLHLRRADNVIAVSVLIMVLMIGLAMSVLLMGIESISDERLELIPLSLSVSLLFGLPALRNAQPGVPPLGAFGDYLSFIWAHLIVTVSAVILIWTWMARQRHAR
jgi:hypothetical protein